MGNGCCWGSRGDITTAALRSSEKKIINFTPQYYYTTIAAALANLKSLPLDGILLDFLWNHTTFGNIAAQKSWMYKDIMPESSISSQITTFKNTDWGRLQHNFLRLRLQPGVADTEEFWNDETQLAGATANIGMLANAARKSGCIGVCWDLEAYASDIQHRMLDYESLKAGFTLDERKTQVRAGMARMARAVWSNFPDAIVFMTFGYEEMYSSTYYDLLQAAIDGILDAMPDSKMVSGDDGIPRVINGLEECYYTDTEPDLDYVFEEKAFRRHADAGGTFHPLYAKTLSMSVGIWLDRTTSTPWDTFSATAPYDKNYYDPSIARLRHNSWQGMVEMAIKYSDMYVWLYVNNNALGFPGESADYHAATLAAINASDMSRARKIKGELLFYVPAASKDTANTKLGLLGLPPLFKYPLIAAGAAPDATPTYYLAKAKLSEAEYRGISVLVGDVAALVWSPEGDYDSADVSAVWLLGQGKRIAGSEISTIPGYLTLSSGYALNLQDGTTITLN